MKIETTEDRLNSEFVKSYLPKLISNLNEQYSGKFSCITDSDNELYRPIHNIFQQRLLKIRIADMLIYDSPDGSSVIDVTLRSHPQMNKASMMISSTCHDFAIEKGLEFLCNPRPSSHPDPHRR